MTKVKPGVKAVKHSAITHFKSVKNNPIQKKKGKQFANTPVGKVRLVNGKKVQNNNGMENKLKNKKKEETEVIKDSPDSPDSNRSWPRNNDNKYSPDSPDSNSSSPKSNDKKNSKKIFNLTKTSNLPKEKSGKNKQTPTKNIDEEDESDESDESTEDINEGIVLPEDSIVSQDDNEDDDDTDEDESETELPNILGQSLADDTDEDDSDFEDKENDEDKNEDEGEDEDKTDHNSAESGASQLKGVKMFKGLLKQKLDSINKNIKKNDEDDNCDDDNDDDDDDDNMDGSNVETDTSMSPGGLKSKKSNANVIENEEDEDSEDEDDDDDDDDDEDDDEEYAPGLKDLLGNSIADDDDSDEDFEGEDEDDEDIDISDEELEADTEELEADTEESDENDKRTIYVGNIPKDTKKEEIKKLFREFGIINSIRIRNVAPLNVKTSKKVAAIKNQIHKNIDHICMLLVFKDEESVSKALCMNGKQFKGYYLRVDSITNKSKPDAKKAVFLGNLSFKISDNDVWKHFGQCGEIDFVRLIRDKKSRMGKGIGYVNFKSEDSVSLALELDGSTLLNRKVRVKRCSDEKVVSKSENKSSNNKNKRFAENRIKKSSKKFKVSDKAETTSPVMNVNKKLKTKGKSEENSSPNSEKKKAVFQGQKANVGKKEKKSKLDKKKKKIAAILTTKPKKVQKV